MPKNYTILFKPEKGCPDRPAARPGGRSNPVDFTLLIVTLMMLTGGIVFIFSSSAFLAKTTAYYLKKQLIALAIGSAAMWYLSANWDRIRRKISPIHALWAVWALLVAALFFSKTANTHRWIKIAGFQLQPSEFAKIALIWYLADHIDRNRQALETRFSAQFKPLAVAGITLLLIYVGRDLGTPALLFAVTMLMMFVGGARMLGLLAAALAMLPLLAAFIISSPYRLKRVQTFLSPEADAQGAGFQLVQSLIAVGSGGWFGKGFGASEMKLMHLPAPHTDFIFAVIAEEIGMLGCIALIALFVGFFICGIKAAKAAADYSYTSALTAYGISALVLGQACFNISMALGLIPTKGLPLPFFSYGGCSLISTMIMTGILLNISRKRTQYSPLLNI